MVNTYSLFSSPRQVFMVWHVCSSVPVLRFSSLNPKPKINQTSVWNLCGSMPASSMVDMLDLDQSDPSRLPPLTLFTLFVNFPSTTFTSILPSFLPPPPPPFSSSLTETSALITRRWRTSGEPHLLAWRTRTRASSARRTAGASSTPTLTRTYQSSFCVICVGANCAGSRLCRRRSRRLMSLCRTPSRSWSMNHQT